MKTPLADRIHCWYTLSILQNNPITRILLHPGDRVEAKKLYPDHHVRFDTVTLPIHFIGDARLARLNEALTNG